MKTFLHFLAAILLLNNATAQSANSTKPDKYDVVVSFNSICCGTPSNDFLKEYIASFNTKNKVVVDAWTLNGCGREGENKVLFSLASLKKSKKTKFISGLQKLVPQQNETNKTASASSGSIVLAYGLPTTEVGNCRGKITRFPFKSKGKKLKEKAI